MDDVVIKCAYAIAHFHIVPVPAFLVRLNPHFWDLKFAKGDQFYPLFKETMTLSC